MAAYGPKIRETISAWPERNTSGPEARNEQLYQALSDLSGFPGRRLFQRGALIPMTFPIDEDDWLSDHLRFPYFTGTLRPRGAVPRGCLPPTPQRERTVFFFAPLLTA